MSEYILSAEDAEYIDRYWNDFERREGITLSYMLSRRASFSQRLYDICKAWETDNYNASLSARRMSSFRDSIADFDRLNLVGAAKLYISDANRRRRLKVHEAAFVILMCTICGHEYDAAEYFKKQLSQNLKEVSVFVSRELNTPVPPPPEHVPDFNRIIPAMGISLNGKMCANAEYYARKMISLILNKHTAAEKQRDIDTITKNIDSSLLRRTMMGKCLYAANFDLAGRVERSEAYLKELIRNGVEKVRFIAVLDNATTDICYEHHGFVFEVKKLVVGYNMPPLFPPYHPCRSQVKPEERLTNNRLYDKIGLGFFGIKYNEYSDKQLLSAREKQNRRTDEHREKIKEPPKYVPWDTLDYRRQNGLVNFWEKEVKDAETQLRLIDEELKRRKNE